MDDDKAQATLKKAVDDYLNIEAEYAAKKLKATGDINTQRKTEQSKVFTRIAKLDVTKEGFLATCRQERHLRNAKSVFPKIDDGEDLGLVGGYSRVALATGSMFEPLYGDEERSKMEGLVEELEAATTETADDGNVVDIKDAA